MAIRWSTLVRRHGFHLTIAHCHRYADEVFEIRLHTYARALFKIHRRGDAVITTHFVGVNSSFPNLAEALSSIVPLSPQDRRFMVKGRRSLDLPGLAGRWVRVAADSLRQGLAGASRGRRRFELGENWTTLQDMGLVARSRKVQLPPPTATTVAGRIGPP